MFFNVFFLILCIIRKIRTSFFQCFLFFFTWTILSIFSGNWLFFSWKRFMLGVHLMTWGAYQSGWFHVENYVAAAISVDWIDLNILTVLSSWERDFMDFVAGKSTEIRDPIGVWYTDAWVFKHRYPKMTPNLKPTFFEISFWFSPRCCLNCWGLVGKDYYLVVF